MRPYPAYKDSGVEWLGEVPEGWEVVPLWSLFRRVKRTGFPEAELLSVYRDFGVVPKASRDDNFNNASEDLSTYQLVKAGDLAINKMKAWQGSVAISEFEGIVSPAYFIFTPTHTEDSRYLHYLMRSAEYTHAYLAHSKGIRPNQWDLEPQEHSRMGIILPPLPEQQAIARFLDKEVAKIDALVAEQRRLIALLAEKRQAVISHAVTKGLNPATPLKPSGIDWLGDIPEGWEVVPLKHVTMSRCDGPFGSGLKSEHYSDAGVRVIRLQNIKLGAFAGEDEAFVDEEYASTALAGHDVESGDLLLAGLGDDRNPVGRCCVAPDDIAPALVKADCFRFRVDKSRVKPLFVALQLSASAVRDAGILATGTTRSRITLTVMANRCLALPTPSEQEAIVTKLLEIQAQFDSLTTAATSAISLLQERRAALISAAVTGKIDLRPHFAQSLSEPETA